MKGRGPVGGQSLNGSGHRSAANKHPCLVGGESSGTTSTGITPPSARAFGSAPASSSTFTTAGLLLRAAQCRGVRPSLALASRSAPASSSAFTTAGFAINAVMCRDVPPSSSFALGSAPASSSAFTTSGVLLYPAALCRGVQASLSRALGSAPWEMQRPTSAAVASSKNCEVFQGRTIRAGKRGARCQQQRRSQQRQDAAHLVTAVAVVVGKGFA